MLVYERLLTQVCDKEMCSVSAKLRIQKEQGTQE